MDHGDDNDDSGAIPLERSGRTPPVPFYLDDAFSDGDDHDPSYEFSSAAIRAELGNSLSPTLVDEEEDSAPVIAQLDASVSTLDIEGHHSNGSSYLSPGPDDFRLSSTQFDQISLSEDAHDDTDDVDEKSAHELETDEGSREDAGRENDGHVREDDEISNIEFRASGSEADDSQDHPAPIDVPRGSPPPAPFSAAATVPSSDNGSVDSPPPSPKSRSSPSLPLPAVPSTSFGATPPPRPSSTHHKPKRSTGPSMFEKVVSKTRPTFLPPKSREEDQKHMEDWKLMMKRSRAAEEKRQIALRDRRLARELKVEQSMPIWEKEVLPNWKAVREVPALRALWWAGIPTKLRSTLWERAVGNALALSKDSYRTCLARAKRAIAVGTFPTTTLGLIEDDVRSTLPSLHIFHPDSGPMYEDLKELLYAWVVSRLDEGLGYVRGTAKLAAMILLNMPAQPGFIVLRNLLERHCMRSFYGGVSSKDDVEAYYRIFDTLLADGMPKIYFNFKQHQISPSSYLPDWILPLFLDHLPFEACARIWDVILLEGDSFLYRASLAILAVLEPRLFFPDRTELMELLRGENKAALDVARRDGRPLNGAKYEIYGVDEETLWDRIHGMDDWWKDSTWTRLLRRELPDI